MLKPTVGQEAALAVWLHLSDPDQPADPNDNDLEEKVLLLAKTSPDALPRLLKKMHTINNQVRFFELVIANAPGQLSACIAVLASATVSTGTDEEALRRILELILQEENAKPYVLECLAALIQHGDTRAERVTNKLQPNQKKALFEMAQKVLQGPEATSAAKPRTTP